MSGRSQKQQMREALLLTERNLSSLISARYCDYKLMRPWRDMCRRALGMMPYPVAPDPDPNTMLAREILARPGEIE